MSGLLDVERVRADFPILATKMRGKPLVFLDSAASAQKPRCVIDTLCDFYAGGYANIHRGVYQLSADATRRYEGTREVVQRFLGAADPREIVFVRNATEAINLVARTWAETQLEAGDEIVITAMEHHANIVPWQMLGERKGSVLRVAPIDEHGDWDEAAIELTVDGDESQCTAKVQAQVLLVSCRAPLALRVPRATVIQVQEVSGDLLLNDLDRPVSVGQVQGDAFVGGGNAAVSFEAVHGDLGVEHLNGPLSATEIHGDLHLKHVSVARVGSVHGDVHARDVASEIELGVVRGDVQLREVAGAVTLEEAHGDFSGRGLLGGLAAHQVRGSLSLKTDLTPGLTYSARAQGDISARFPPETSARFTLHAQGDVSAKGVSLEEQEPGHYVGQAGEGEAEVVLETNGSLSVKVRGSEDEHEWGLNMEALGAEIEAKVAAHMGELEHGQFATREIEKAMRQVEREIERAQHQAERSAERAQERAQRAEERARKAQEKALERAKKLQDKVEYRWNPRLHDRRRTRASARGPRPARRASGEEQAAILNMLQAGKISVEEAETLLKALGS